MSDLVRKAELEILRKKIDEIFDQHKLIVTQRKWRAFLSSTQYNIPDNTWTKIQFNSLTYDCEGVGFSSYGYPVQVDGIYDITLHARWNDTIADAFYGLRIYIDGVGKSIGGSPTPIISSLYVEVNDKLPINKNQVIYGYVWHNGGAATPDIGGGEWLTYMTIHLISRKCK